MEKARLEFEKEMQKEREAKEARLRKHETSEAPLPEVVPPVCHTVVDEGLSEDDFLKMCTDDGRRTYFDFIDTYVGDGKSKVLERAKEVIYHFGAKNGAVKGARSLSNCRIPIKGLLKHEVHTGDKKTGKKKVNLWEVDLDGFNRLFFVEYSGRIWFVQVGGHTETKK